MWLFRVFVVARRILYNMAFHGILVGKCQSFFGNSALVLPKHCKIRNLGDTSRKTWTFWRPLWSPWYYNIQYFLWFISERHKIATLYLKDAATLICWRGILCATFWPFGELETVPPFFEYLTFTAAMGKMKVRNCTTGELETVPPQGSILDPQKWYSF